MIGHLRGTIIEKHPNYVLVEVSGVGYEIHIPVSTFTALPAEGASAALRIHTHVREDALALFGFATVDEKVIFERLISVSGIGPKLAIAVLSGLATADLAAAIRAGQVERLVRIPGVGKKTAERIVLELRDKLPPLNEAAAQAPQVQGSPLSAVEQDVVSALQNLGCSRAAAEEALSKVKQQSAEQSFEPLFRAALARIR
jgi:Holliday junction DNA helicase RuvA